MARTYQEFLQQTRAIGEIQAGKPAEQVVAEEIAAAPKPVVSAAPTAKKPAAPKQKQAAQPPAPKVTQGAAVAQPVAQEKVKDVSKQFELPPDISRVVDYRPFYDNASTPFYNTALRQAASAYGMTADQLEKLAQSQGVSLEQIHAARQKGRSFSDIKSMGAARGVLGFLPVEERRARFLDSMKQLEDATQGIASDEIVVKPAKESTKYAVMGTRTELPEVSKPGEHGYEISRVLVDALKNDTEQAQIYDLYGRSTSTGATIKYVEKRTEQLAKRAGITASTPDALGKMARLRKRAINEVLAYKTIGMWTPAVVMQFPEVTEGERAPSFLEASAPNIELIGINNKGQAIFRQESGLGVALRMIDIPQAAVTGWLSGEGAARGLQTGANLFEYAYDKTEGASPWIRTPTRFLGFVGSVAFPDVFLAGGAAAKAAKAGVREVKITRNAPKVVGLLDEVTKARNAGDFAAAHRAESEIRKILPIAGDHLDQYDAATAQVAVLKNPADDIANEDLAAVIASNIPTEEAHKFAASRSWLHPAERQEALMSKDGKRMLQRLAPDEAYDTQRLLNRVRAARANHLDNFPDSLDAYAKMYARGTARDLVTNLPDGMLELVEAGRLPKLAATDVDEIGKIVEKAGPKAGMNAQEFGRRVAQGLEAHRKFGQPEYAEYRLLLRGPGKNGFLGRVGRKMKDIAGKTVDELKVPDAELFNRAEKAIEKNNEIRAVAADLLREKLATDRKIVVRPSELFNDVVPVGADGKPIKLSEGALQFVAVSRKFYPERKLEELLAVATILDKQVQKIAKKIRRDPYTVWAERAPALMRATPAEIRRYGGKIVRGGTTPPPVAPPAAAAPVEAPPAAPAAAAAAEAVATPPTAPAAAAAEVLDTMTVPGSPTAAALAWQPKVAAGTTLVDVQDAGDAKKLIQAAVKGELPKGSARMTFIGPDGAVATTVVVGDVRITWGTAKTRDGTFGAYVKVGGDSKPITGKAAAEEALKAAQTLAYKWMGGRAGQHGIAIRGVPDYLKFADEAASPPVPPRVVPDAVEAVEAPVAPRKMTAAGQKKLEQLQSEFEAAVEADDLETAADLEREMGGLLRSEDKATKTATPVTEATPTPTIAEPPTPAPIVAAAEAQPEAAKIVEAPAPVVEAPPVEAPKPAVRVSDAEIAKVPEVKKAMKARQVAANKLKIAQGQAAEATGKKAVKAEAALRAAEAADEEAELAYQAARNQAEARLVAEAEKQPSLFPAKTAETAPKVEEAVETALPPEVRDAQAAERARFDRDSQTRKRLSSDQRYQRTAGSGPGGLTLNLALREVSDDAHRALRSASSEQLITLARSLPANDDPAAVAMINDVKRWTSAAPFSAPEAPTSPAFKSWFRGSKVVDERGEPLVVYHGSTRPDIDTFDASKSAPTSAYGPGSYFATDPSVASDFASELSSGRGLGLGRSADYPYTAAQRAAVAEEARKMIAGSNAPEAEKALADIAAFEDGKVGGFFLPKEVLPKEPATRYGIVDVEVMSLRGLDERGAVYPVYLSIKNPLDLNAPLSKEIWSKIWTALTGDAEVAEFAKAQLLLRNSKRKYELPIAAVYDALHTWAEGGRLPAAEHAANLALEGRAKQIINQTLAQEGFDGLHIRADLGEEWIAFEPTQVKSATGNAGTFSPTEPSILKSIEPTEDLAVRGLMRSESDIPERFRVAAESRLRKAAEGLENGKISQAQYNKLVDDVQKDLAAQAEIRAAQAASKDRMRGADWVRSRLLAAKNAGVLDTDGVDLADWFIQQNPALADGLGVSIVKGGEDAATAGFYESASQIAVLVKERGSATTATHEILHHTERMLPAPLRTAIQNEWAKRLTAAIKSADANTRPFLEKMLARTDAAAVERAFMSGKLSVQKYYQFVNPSEFWAVNASTIVSGRYAAFKGGLVAKAKQWLVEFAQKVKSVFGLSSDAPLIRGLDAVIKGDGTFVTERMLSEGRALQVQRSASDILDELQKTQFIPTPQLLRILGDSRPEYLDNVAAFILEQRNKVREGRLTVRDVAKAYLPTVASQRAGAIDAARVEAILGPLDDRFIVLGKKGQRQVRPEEAMAAWMFSPNGQRALDALEQGKFDAEAWETVAALRDIWGNNTLRNSGVFGTPRKGAVTMQNLKAVVDEINAAGGDVAKVEAAVRKLNGVGNAKTPFISHLLGFGESPTMDAVEFNGWLTGRADIGPLSTTEANLARDLKARQDVNKIAMMMADRAMDRFRALRAAGVSGTDLPDEVFGAIMHHWFWDKLKDAQTTHAGMYDALRYASLETPTEGKLFKSIEDAEDLIEEATSPVVRLYTPAGDVQGIVQTMANGRDAIKLFENADLSTVIRGVGVAMRRSALDVEDMNLITNWIRSMGIQVQHRYGEFVGSAEDVERAEVAFGQALERYVMDGVSANPEITAALGQIKDGMLDLYRNVSDPVVGAPLSAEVRQTFDKILSEAGDAPKETVKNIIRRRMLGGTNEEVEFLQTLAMEAERKGLPESSVEKLQAKFDAVHERQADAAREATKRYRSARRTTARADLPALTDAYEAELKGILSDDTVYFKFEVPVLGKTEWTLDDLARAQAELDIGRSVDRARARGLRVNLRSTSKTTGALVEEETAVEKIRSALTPREADKGLVKTGKAGLRVVTATFFGGDVIAEKAARYFPPEMRKALDTVERTVEESIGDTITLVNDALRTGDDRMLIKYLAGESGIRRFAGRPLVSAGHDYMGSVLGMFRRMFDNLDASEQDALRELADIMNSPNRADVSRRMTEFGFVADELTLGMDAEQAKRAFKKGMKAAEAKADALRSAVTKVLFLSKSTEGSNIGEALSAALRNAVGAPPHGGARVWYEMQLIETLTYLAGKTERGGKLFDGTSQDAARLLLGSEKIPGSIAKVYGDEAMRRVAVLIGGYGSADLAKNQLVKLDLGLSPDARRAFESWAAGGTWDPKYAEDIQRIVDRYGYNPQLVEDAVLGANVYIPREARERLAQALARSTYRPGQDVAPARMINTLYRYMKTRMTRGSFFLRPRYYMMNTVDHFMQMGMVNGFGVAARSTARLIMQDLMVLPAWQQIVELISRVPGAERIPGVGRLFSPDVLERARAGLQRYGDRISWMMSASKYRIEVNPILEGVEGGFRVGNKVYSYKEVRRIAVQEGVFASFDTRQLANAIERDGALVINEQLAKVGDVAASSQGVSTARQGLIRGPLRNFFSDWQKTVSDTAEAWGERERLGAMVTLMEAGYDPRTSARLVIDALYDYSQSMTKADRSLLVGVMFPFWAFQKNANQQIFNLMFSPWGAYRMMCLQRARERGADWLAEILYDDVGSEYDLDVKSMPPELQDTYYSIVTAFEEAYGGNPPVEAKRALRMLLTNRARDVEQGKFIELSPVLTRLRGAGTFAEIANKFAPYVQMRPSKSNRMSYLRDREGIPVPFPRTEIVQAYNKLLGDQHAYLEYYLPESTIESGMKHLTQVAAAYIMLGSIPVDYMERSAQSAGLYEGETLTDRGAQEVKLTRLIGGFFDPARSPFIGPVIADISEDYAPPKKIAKKLEAGVAGVTKVHPLVGKIMDDAFGTTFLRVPELNDPFVIGAANGDITKLTPEQIEQIKRLQSEYPDIGKLREERYYIPGGVWTHVFENSPFGELNAMLLNWEESPAERANIRGKILAWARGTLGADVAEVSAKKTMRAEEPTKMKETKGL